LNDGHAFRRNDCRRARSSLVRSGLDGHGAATDARPATDLQVEKCYGIVKSAKNDCATVTSSCAGTAKRDNQPDSWVYVPAGTCDKIVGGSTTPKQS
jgi:uncharacterized membrane protein